MFFLLKTFHLSVYSECLNSLKSHLNGVLVLHEEANISDITHVRLSVCLGVCLSVYKITQTIMGEST